MTGTSLPNELSTMCTPTAEFHANFVPSGDQEPGPAGSIFGMFGSACAPVPSAATDLSPTTFDASCSWKYSRPLPIVFGGTGVVDGVAPAANAVAGSIVPATTLTARLV